jgi:hypothetical protein
VYKLSFFLRKLLRKNNGGKSIIRDVKGGESLRRLNDGENRNADA